MKRFLVYSVVLVSILTTLIPVSVGAAPGYEIWESNSFYGGAASVSYSIQLNNLRTNEWYFVNNTDYPLYFAIIHNDWVTIEMQATCPPHSSLTEQWTVNFQRIPHTDPIDPDSVRMPADMIFYARLG